MAKKASKSGFEERYGGVKSTSRDVLWDAAEPSLVYRIVAAVGAVPGCAVLFGKTRDGGAWSIRFYEDGVGHTDYCSDPDDLNDWLLEHAEWWEGYAEQKRSETA